MTLFNNTFDRDKLYDQIAAGGGTKLSSLSSELDTTEQHILAVKSTVHFRADYDGIAARTLRSTLQWTAGDQTPMSGR